MNNGGSTTGSFTMTMPRRTPNVSAANIGCQKQGCDSNPLYCPHLTSCDFLLFLRIKSQLQWQNFLEIPKIQEQMLTVLDTIPKRQFQLCFQQWQKCWT
jgi:hypothetical protein